MFYGKVTKNFTEIAVHKPINVFLREWRCGDGSRTAPTFKIEFFLKIVHDCQPLITIVTKSYILDVAETLNPPLYADIPELPASPKYSE